MSDWHDAWHAVASRWVGRPFEIGATDCVQLAAAYLEARGLEHAALPPYRTPLAASCLVGRYGGIPGAAAALVGRQSDYVGAPDSGPGDLVVIWNRADMALGIRLDRWVALPDEVGLTFRRPAGNVLMGWRI